MNIYAKDGHRVRYLGGNGYAIEREHIEKLGVKAGDILTVRYTDVGDCRTAVVFHEIASYHNSVMFEDA